MAESRLYLDIYTLGLFFVFFYNISNGIFSALGDSRTPFWFLACSSVANIAVDVLFVAVFRMGVAGVAWATFLCQGVSCILAMATVLLRLKKIEASQPYTLFSLKALKEFTIIAVPSTLQQGFVSVGNIIIQGIINSFGPGVIAGYSAGIKLNNLVITSYTTLGNGVSNFTSQNLGGNRRDRIPAGFKAGIRMVWILTVPFFLLYFFLGGPLVKLFMDTPTDSALSTGITLLRIVSPFYFFICMKIVADGVLRGSGMMKCFMASTFTDLVARVVLAKLFSMTALGSVGIWLAWPVGWLIAVVMSLFFYYRAYGSKSAQIQAE